MTIIPLTRWLALGWRRRCVTAPRGLTLGMYLSLFKYYRQCYLDLIDEADFAEAQKQGWSHVVHRYFDRIELGLTTAWADSSSSDRLHELQVANRFLANEKNKYLTIFESLHDPVILLDQSGAITNMNHAAATLFVGALHPGDVYYGNSPSWRQVERAEGMAWLDAALMDFTGAGHSRLEFAQTLSTSAGERYFLIKLEQMLDVSDKFMGVVVLLNDLTERRRAEGAPEGAYRRAVHTL